MNIQSWMLRTGCALIGTGTVLAVVAGCATSKSSEVTSPRPKHEVSGVIHYRIYETRQLGTGEAAYFARCLSPVCPSVSRKTIASVELAKPRGEPQSVSAPVEPIAHAPANQVETAVVHFDHGSARLGRQAQRTLAQFDEVARQSQRIVISGRTDNTGGDDVNRALAHARALAVADYLRSQSAARAERIVLDPKGRCCYVARNESEGERKLNRRAEVSFYQTAKVAQ